MKVDIYANKRVLYKHNGGQWVVGHLMNGNAVINEKGLFIPVVSKENEDSYENIEINDLFLDAILVDEWMKQYDDLFMTKENYINFIEDAEFTRAIERAYVSDGEYIYYPVSKYTRNWLEKQPFEYIVRYT